MIRRFLHLEAPPDRVADHFHAVESWPEWMSGMRSVRIVDLEADDVRIEVVQIQMGRTIRQVLACHIEPRALHLRQLEGRFRRWEAHWRFVTPPCGGGTTVEMSLDFDLGALAMLVPRRMLHEAVDRVFRQTGAALRSRLAEEPNASTRIVGADAARLLNAIRSGSDVVLEVAGHRYRLVPEKPTRGVGY